MYDYIQEAIDREECLLEWDGGPDHTPPPAPLLKDKFASERRKAKVNYTIKFWEGLQLRLCVAMGRLDSRTMLNILEALCALCSAQALTFTIWKT
jgi:hypothetical protein